MYKIDLDKPCHIHFLGIGGISMSGLAEVLLGRGFTVSGSDIKESAITDRLQSLGAKVYYSQVKENITDDIEAVVYTAAVHPDNEEYAKCEEMGIPMLKRAELLGQIMSHYSYAVAVSGTHGKTTTTSMLAHVFMTADVDPTVSIGGMLDAIDGNIRVGKSEYFVTEACEYTNSYHSLDPYISIILNIDNDHLDFFKNIDNIVESFRVFAGKIRRGGTLIINGDMSYKDHVCENFDGNIITFGLNDGNDYQARNITLDKKGHPEYDLYVRGEFVTKVSLSVMGEHNAMNSLSVIAASEILGIGMDDILEGLKQCKSAHRRFEYKGTLPGNVTVIDDYAHHPTEIAATLRVANAIKENELWCIFQPHTYSRTYEHLDEFAEVLSVCDHVIVADIYSAREKDTGLVSSGDLVERIVAKGTDAVFIESFEEIEKYFEKNFKENDLLITMGAGNIDIVGENLLKK